jgi:hypothetical protein
MRVVTTFLIFGAFVVVLFWNGLQNKSLAKTRGLPLSWLLAVFVPSVRIVFLGSPGLDWPPRTTPLRLLLGLAVAVGGTILANGLNHMYNERYRIF